MLRECAMEPLPHHTNSIRNDLPDLHFLLPEQIEMIDEALCCIGEYGEVHLVVEKGKLRFIEVNTSVDVRSWNSKKPNLLSTDR
jgi:hypothetical protein